MPNTQIRRCRLECRRLASAAICLSAICAGTLFFSSAADASLRGCATRDLQVLMLIEERESANAISAPARIEALDAMMHARSVCRQGRVLDALALYEGISEGIRSDAPRSGHRSPDTALEHGR